MKFRRKAPPSLSARRNWDQEGILAEYHKPLQLVGRRTHMTSYGIPDATIRPISLLPSALRISVLRCIIVITISDQPS
jgi:hypothetical protein